MSDSQPDARAQYTFWRKWPGTYREPTHEEWVRAYDQLRGTLSLAEEGLANYAQELADLRRAYEYQRGNAERLRQRCWALAVLVYPYGEPRIAVAGDLGLSEPQTERTR
jgi:hypothetical protein